MLEQGGVPQLDIYLIMERFHLQVKSKVQLHVSDGM